MLTIVVADSKPFRTSRIASIVAEYAISEVIVFDDTVLTISDLEQYVYPSLFSSGTPLIHTRFIFETKEKELMPVLLKKLIASPTMFIVEELSLSKPFLTAIKKQGAVVYTVDKPAFGQASGAAKDTIFSVTNVITIASKKDRWIAYQKAIAQYPIEGILGMLYWKVRDMALKEKSQTGTYHTLYTKMLEAHATAWQEGTPLALAIEKVLLLY
jgi:hypothetical protein